MEGLPPMVVASFPGSFHLARLLEVASSALIEVAVINIDQPYGVPADRWHHSMARVAKKRTTSGRTTSLHSGQATLNRAHPVQLVFQKVQANRPPRN